MYEPHLLQPQAYNALLGRLDQLSPASQRLWGQMDVAQMLAHLAANLQLALGDKTETQTFLGRVFGPAVKRRILKHGLSRNIPTSPGYKISDQRQFQLESERVRLMLDRFFEGGEAGITRHPHDFFGRMTPSEWARLQYVHMDHHLKQFGV